MEMCRRKKKMKTHGMKISGAFPLGPYQSRKEFFWTLWYASLRVKGGGKQNATDRDYCSDDDGKFCGVQDEENERLDDVTESNVGMTANGRRPVV